MPLPQQTPHRELLRKLRDLGFEGPLPGGRHPIMKKGQLKLHIPTPHGQDVGIEVLRRILKQAGISAEEWERA